MGATAPAELNESAPAEAEVVAPQAQAQPSVSISPIERLQTAVLQALTDGNQRILVSMLQAGEWSVEGNEVVVKVSESQTVVDMSVGADARRLAIASASGVLGRAVKLKIVPGASPAAVGKSNGAALRPAPTAGGRSRAEQDSVVRRLQEKFGAEIRTVIDYKEKR
jgi:DNA polymerase-3 subunit gamma/tau